MNFYADLRPFFVCGLDFQMVALYCMLIFTNLTTFLIAETTALKKKKTQILKAFRCWLMQYEFYKLYN